jgi:hypothetical protein
VGARTSLSWRGDRRFAHFDRDVDLLLAVVIELLDIGQLIVASRGNNMYILL